MTVTLPRNLTMDAALQLALRMADRADEMAKDAFGGKLRIERKADGTPVTHVDREIELVLRATLGAEHGDAGILGEEYGERIGTGRWVIDPIDGTRQFIDQDPRFSVLIAFELDQVPMIGVVSVPMLGVRWYAARGSGAWFVGRAGQRQRLQVSEIEPLARSVGAFPGRYGDNSIAVPGIIEPTAAWRRLVDTGSHPAWIESGFQAAGVANGDFDYAFVGGDWWDVAPFPVIIQEAGGTAVIYRERPRRFGVLLTNGRLERDIVDLVGRPATTRVAPAPDRESEGAVRCSTSRRKTL